ncbi:MAG: hypothetical protein GY811_07785 [Myxococcales bacterium]|nr:hypothetical protein [Myxococcales bacterium]
MSKTMQLPVTFARLRFSKHIFAALVACLGLLAAGGVAEADDADCTVFEIKASGGEGGIDAELKPITSKLKKPPFSAWKTFKVVKRHSLKAPHMKAVSVPLAGGGKLGLLYKERSDAKGSKPRLRVGMTLDNAAGKRKADITLKVDSGDYTLVGQDEGKDGSSRLLAISCAIK